MGSQRDDFVHEIYLTELRKLQNQVPPEHVDYGHYPIVSSMPSVYDACVCTLSAAAVKALVETETGRSFNEVFSSIDPEPLGAASIGQVRS